MGGDSHSSSNYSWGSEVVQVNLELVIEVKTVHVTSRGQMGIEDAVDGVNSYGVASREGL